MDKDLSTKDIHDYFTPMGSFGSEPSHLLAVIGGVAYVCFQDGTKIKYQISTTVHQFLSKKAIVECVVFADPIFAGGCLWDKNLALVTFNGFPILGQFDSRLLPKSPYEEVEKAAFKIVVDLCDTIQMTENE